MGIKHSTLSAQQNIPKALTGFAVDQRRRYHAIVESLQAQPRNLRRQLTRRARLGLADIALLLTLGISLPAQAATLLVNTNLPGIDENDGACSLSEAIHNANLDTRQYVDCIAGAGADIIELLPGSQHVITAQAPDYPGQGIPSIASKITILGNGANLRVAAGIPVDAVINNLSSGDLALSDATISGDADSGSGSRLPRVQNAGTMQLTNVTILLNHATMGVRNLPSGTLQASNVTVDLIPDFTYPASAGMGIHNQGEMRLENSRIQNLYFQPSEPSSVLLNEGSLQLAGFSLTDSGAFYSDTFLGLENAGELHGTHVTVANNYGNGDFSGVLNHIGATLTLEDSVITNNLASQYSGGAGGFFSGGTASLLRVVIEGNANGVYNYGALDMRDSSVSNNGGDRDFGAGLRNHNTLILTNVTVAGNYGDRGGLANYGDAQVTNSTISDNFGAYGYTGGINNTGTMTITASTIAAGTYSKSGVNNYGDLSLSHTLIVGKQIINNRGTISQSEYNFFGDSSQTAADFFQGFTPGAMDIVATADGTLPTALADIIELVSRNTSHKFPYLRDNGGPTLTVALAEGSPAIDAGAAHCQALDQRGIVRPQGGACDIGAFEREESPAATCTPFTGYQPRGCTDVVRIRNTEELAAYKASNYGLDSDGYYRHLRIMNNLGDSTVPLDIHSPCKITVVGPASLIGSQVTLDGKRGVLMQWGSQIETDGSACLLSEKNNVNIKGGHRLEAAALTLQAERLARIGAWSHVTVSGPLTVNSTGEGTTSRAEIANDNQIMAGSLDLRSAYDTSIKTRTMISTTGDTHIEAGDVAGSIAALRYQSVIHAGGNLTLNSGGESLLGAETQTQVSGTISMNAASLADCRVANTALVSAAQKVGNCAPKLSR